MPRASWLPILLLAGCSFEARSLPVAGDGGLADAPAGDGPLGDGPRADAPPADARPADGPLPDAPLADAPVDAPPPLPDAGPCWPWTPTNFDPCMLPASNGSATEHGGATFNTDTGVTTFASGDTTTPISALLPQAGATSIRVIVFDDYQLLAPLRVVGSHPLLVVAQGSLTVGGGSLVDVSASTAADGVTTPGPGGNDPIACGGGTGGTGETGEGQGAGSGGGGGGAFGAAGGHGGAGGGASSGGGASGGMPGGAGLAPLRGGCAGGPGGGASADAGGSGAGGGAIQIVARDTLTLSGAIAIVAGGAGGGAGQGRAGGGGGGSGGGIFLEAGTVAIQPAENGSPAVCANGGSGGEGGGSGTSAVGQPGTCSPFVGAVTVGTSTNGGDGGGGGYRGGPAGLSGLPAAPDGADTGVGGGGGGGSVGRVRIRSALAPATVDGLITPEPE